MVVRFRFWRDISLQYAVYIEQFIRREIHEELITGVEACLGTAVHTDK
jgi:hypothetical protein